MDNNCSHKNWCKPGILDLPGGSREAVENSCVKDEESILNFESVNDEDIFEWDVNYIIKDIALSHSAIL